MNEAYWQSPDGPVFLFIGGEGPVHELDVLTGTVGCSTCDSADGLNTSNVEKKYASAKKLSDTLLQILESGKE